MTVQLIHGFTTDPTVGPYVRGRLTLSGLDTRVDAGSYLDAVYAIVAEAPGDTLDKMMRKIVEIRARIAPDRATWGLEPEHRAMSSGLQPGPGDEGVSRVARSLGEAEVRVTANVTKLAVQIRAAIKAAVRGAAGDVALNIDTKGLRAKIRAAIDAALNPNPVINFDVDVNTKTATARLAALSAQASKDERKTVHVDVDRGLRSIGRLVGGLLSGTGALIKFGTAFGAVAASAQGVGVLLGGLTAIIGQLAGGLVVLPGLLFGLIGLFAGLKIGMSGVGDALKNAFDPANAEKFNEAMSKLAPSARETVLAIRGLGPGFRELKLDVQQQLFEGLGTRISAVGKTYLPMLRDNLRQVSAAFGAGAIQTLDYLNTASGTTQVGVILGNTAQMARNLGASLAPAIEGLITMGNVGSGQLPLLGQAIENASIKFRDWANAARDSGAMQQMIDNAKRALSDLGTVASNIGGILGAMWAAADTTGQSFLTGLVNITGEMNTFLNSAAGASALGGVFDAIAAGASVFRAALAAILPALSPILAALGQVAQAVAGPLIQGFGALAPVLVGLGTAIGQVVAMFGPFLGQLIGALMPVIAQVAGTFTQLATTLMSALGPVLPVIAQAFSAVAAAVGPVIAALGAALGPVLAALAPVLGQIAQVLAGVLVQAFAALAPVLPIIGQALSAVVSAFGPLLGVVVQLAGTLLSALLPVLGPIAQILSTVLVSAFQILTPVITALTPIIGQLAGLLAGILMQALNALAPIFPVIAEAAASILAAFMPLLPVIAQLAQAVLPPLLSIFLALVPAIIPLVQAIGQILTAVMSILAPIIQVAAAILGAIVGMVASVLAVVAGFVAGVIGFLASLLGGAISIVGSIVGGVLGFFANLASGVINMVGGFVSGVIGFFGVMLGGVIGAISTLVGGVLGAIGNMISGALGALSGWVGRMVQVGVDVVNGIVNGLRSAASRVTDFLIGLARDALGAVKRFLGIASPSKAFATVGRDMGRGMVVGLTRIAPTVVRASEALGRAATEAIGSTVRIPALDAARDDLGRRLAQQGIVTQPFDVGSLVRPNREAQAQAAPPVDPDGLADAVRQGTYEALNGSRLEVSGTGLARLVNEGNRDLARR